jgi:glycosyltransferase involved in cell wall biosynthesis
VHLTPDPDVEASSLKVLHWGTYDLGKPRTRIMRAGLRASGTLLSDCHIAVWEGMEDKTQRVGFVRRLRHLIRWWGGYPVLVWRFLRAPRPDVVLTSFPGLVDTIVLAPFARLRRVPIVWDMFISTYDTLVFDRCLVQPASPAGRMLHWVEGLAVRCARLVLLDTGAHARRIERLFGLPEGKCRAVHVGAEVAHFQPCPAPQGGAGPLRVLFYGQFIPLHGIDTIITAARQMLNETVEWTVIGRGQEAPRIRAMLAETPLPKLRWIEWVNYEELRSWIAQADLCLGIFGRSDKAASVIPNKVFQIVAAGRPLVTRDSAAIRELLHHAPPCVYLVPPGDPDALAEAIRTHRRYVTEHPGPECHGELVGRIHPAAIGRDATHLLISELGRRW